MESRRLTWGRALGAGLAGAAAVTLANELGRRALSGAPRLDLLGERAAAKLTSLRGVRRFVPGKRKKLRAAALAGGLASNAVYYALAVPGRSRPIASGLGAGLLAGVGAVALAPRLGLGHRPSDATLGRALLTVAWYTVGGLAAGATARAMAHTDHFDATSPLFV